ncbi:alcohol dehydrogenase catalytic domain-containing protein [Streptomyces sp. M92]|uniref:alcohol dehydrogenase catalytic domain-containing protein n=1 Tax=Streptomyces sp. M92 TaxID=2944250 RepID=UPI00234A14B4|nr:alcohol dehydrogenase catalytic domain-containing protein [Streptomyces sp. M92]
MAEVPAPEVSGPHDVIVRIGAAGVRRTDPHIPEGQWAEQSGVCLPYAIGHENAGWAHAVGSAVTSGAEGDKVIVHPLMACRAGGRRRPLRAVAVPRHRHRGRLRRVPQDDGPQCRPPRRLPRAGRRRRLRPGDRCAVIGAGGLGHIGIQVLKALTVVELVVDFSAGAVPPATASACRAGPATTTWSGTARTSTPRRSTPFRPRSTSSVTSLTAKPACAS